MRYFKWAISALVFAFYSFALIVDRSAGVIYMLLLLLSIGSIATIKISEKKSFIQFIKTYWPLNLAMCGPSIAILINQIGSAHFSLRTYDSSFRLAMFVLIFWIFSFLSIKNIKFIQWAFMSGAILSSIKIYILTDRGTMRYGTDFIPIIIFGEMALLLGVFSILSIVWNKNPKATIIFIKIIALCAGLYVAYLSQSRGVWLTIPVFLLLGSLVAQKISYLRKLGFLIAIVIFFGTVSHFNGMVKDRLAVAETDLGQYSTGSDLDTSLGIRLQLWQASWLLFIEHPLIGVGLEGFPNALQNLADRKIITPVAAALPHSHNEILFTISRLGIFGLFAILGLYFSPIYYFFRELRHCDNEVRYTAAMGLSLCFGFFTLGLVDVVFLWWEVFPYYSISIALLLTFIIKRKSVLSGIRSYSH